MSLEQSAWNLNGFYFLKLKHLKMSYLKSYFHNYVIFSPCDSVSFKTNLQRTTSLPILNENQVLTCSARTNFESKIYRNPIRKMKIAARPTN